MPYRRSDRLSFHRDYLKKHDMPQNVVWPSKPLYENPINAVWSKDGEVVFNFTLK